MANRTIGLVRAPDQRFAVELDASAEPRPTVWRCASAPRLQRGQVQLGQRVDLGLQGVHSFFERLEFPQ